MKIIRTIYWLKCFFKELVSTFLVLIISGAGCSDFSENVGNGYFYHRINSINQIIAPKVWDNKTAMIPARVILYKKSGKFVSAKREAINDAKHVSDMLTGMYDYWVLNTLKSEVFGPMEKSEFVKLVKSLNLLDELNFD